MTKTIQPQWTAHLNIDENTNLSSVLQQLCMVFNQSPFMLHNGINMQVVDEKIHAHFQMQPFLVGNVAYQILHGGVTATVLDSVGGINAMAALYKKTKFEDRTEVLQKISRLATLDFRVDYLLAGKGEFFVADAEVLRMGKKSCTMRMNLMNDQKIVIATAIASYAY